MAIDLWDFPPDDSGESWNFGEDFDGADDETLRDILNRMLQGSSHTGGLEVALAKINEQFNGLPGHQVSSVDDTVDYLDTLLTYLAIKRASDIVLYLNQDGLQVGAVISSDNGNKALRLPSKYIPKNIQSYIEDALIAKYGPSVNRMSADSKITKPLEILDPQRGTILKSFTTYISNLKKGYGYRIEIEK